MRLLTWTSFFVYTIGTSALAIPNVEPTNDAIAGSIAASNVTKAADPALAALEYEYQKLEILKHQMIDLHQKFRDQEYVILALIKEDFRSCSGIKCYLQTALRKAPDFYNLMATHFRPVPDYAKNGTWSCPWTSTKPKEVPLNKPFEFGDAGVEISSRPPFSFGDDTEQSREPTVLPPLLPPSPEDDSFRLKGTDRWPPPPFHRRPPPGWHPDHPDLSPIDLEHQPWNPNQRPPPSAFISDSNDSPNKPHHHPFHMPHRRPHHNLKIKLILISGALVIALVIFAILFKSIRIYLSNPRVQADRAARREECRTRREYRRAACQHRIRQCLSKFRGRRRSRSTDDYEEKRAMLLRRENESQISSHIVGTNIISLRRAHDLVRQLMRVEEGRMNTNHIAEPTQEEPVANSSRSVRSLQTTTTLPPYAPPPPRYSQELSRDMEVVDGFRYTPSHSDATELASSASSFVINDDDLCTESSVVDCQSRMSMDTDSVAPSQAGRGKKSLELAGDRFRGRFD